MKKILIIIILYIISSSTISYATTQIFDDGSSLTTTTYDDGSQLHEAIGTDGQSSISSSPSTDGNGNTQTNSSPSGTTTTFTSEKVPGANCVPVYDVSQSSQTFDDGTSLSTTKNIDGTTTTTSTDLNGNKNTITSGNAVALRKYKCTLPTGLAGFQTIFAQIIRWVINIVLLLGVLAVVGLGIAWSFAGGDDIKAKSTLKKWAINIIIGLIILFFFTYILRLLAPWVYQ